MYVKMIIFSFILWHIISLLREKKMPKKLYQDSDYYFYQWWKTVYQDEMHLYDKFSKPDPINESDFKRWEILRAYFRGLVDGRRRQVQRP